MPRTVTKAAGGHHKARNITLTAMLLFIIAFLVWWYGVYQNSNRVFWGMMSNNLVTASVTKHDVGTQQGSTTDQYTQIQFGPVSASRAISTVKQQGNLVVSETIGTQKNDFSRYLKIQTSQKTVKGHSVDASKVVGIWGKTPDVPAGQPSTVQYFQQSVLGIVPFGDFNSQQRNELIALMQRYKAYSLGPVKSSTLAGQAVYVYAVNISPQGLVYVLQQYAKDLGLGNIGLNPSQYAGSAAVQTQFTVGKTSHQLVNVHFAANNQDEAYSSQGLVQPISVPTQTISLTNLQNRVEKSLQ